MIFAYHHLKSRQRIMIFADHRLKARTSLSIMMGGPKCTLDGYSPEQEGGFASAVTTSSLSSRKG